MKKYLILFVTLVSLAFAQEMQMPSKGQMQKMMAQMQEMQMCMQKIDQTELQEMQQKAMTMQKKIKKMCSSGKRGEAQKTAMKFSKKMMNSPSIKQMQKCSKPFETSFPDEAKGETKKSKENQHVCDVGFDLPEM